MNANIVIANVHHSYVFMIIFCILLLNQVPSLLTPFFLDHLINSCRSATYKKDILSVTSREALQFLVTHVTTNNDEKVISEVLCKILFDSGHLLVDKITGIKDCIFFCICIHVRK